MATSKKSKIGIVGIGMVGAPLKRWFEEELGYQRGKNLFLYDIDVKKNYFDDVSQADVVFLTLPTPRNPKNGACDTSIVEGAIKKISANGNQSKILVIKSTIPPGTTEYFQKKYPKHQFLFNPEFLTESRAWEDMIRPDRQIVGFTKKSIDAANIVLGLLPKAPFMSPWGLGTYQPIRLTATEAEFVKYAGNLHFVRKVNWANALALASAKLGADYENVRRAMAADHRIGDSHLDVNHGGYSGWGGFCFPKDTAAFMALVKKYDLKDIYELISADWRFNEKILGEQGLTIEDVSKHINELELIEKRKKHRTKQ